MEQIRISHEAYMNWKDQPILHDEDDWDGKYRTYGEMWEGEGYIVEKERKMMKTTMEVFNEKQIKWSQWTPTEGMIRCGFAPYRQIMKWMQELGLEAKKYVLKSEKNHCLYGRKFHDDQGRITEIRLYCETCVTDEELDAIQRGNLDTLYVAHK